MKSTTASFYEHHQTDHPVLEDRLRKVLDMCVRLRPSSVVDVGCGRGTFARELRERLPDVRYYGIEVSPTLAQVARQQGVAVFEQDLTEPIPLEDESVDLVFMGEVIEHVFDPDASLEAVRRVLRPGGHLIVTTPNLVSWTNRALVLLGIQPLYSETSTRKKYGRWLRVLGQGNPVQGHIRLFTRGALCELLADVGFTVERIVGTRFFELDRNPVTKLLDSVFCLRPSLASGLIVVSRKQVKQTA